LRQTERQLTDAQIRLLKAGEDLGKAWQGKDEALKRQRDIAADDLEIQRRSLERLREEEKNALQSDAERRERAQREEYDELMKDCENRLRDAERERDTERQRYEDMLKQRDADSERERADRERAEETAEAALKRALDVQTEAERAEAQRDARRDAELRRMREDRDHCKQQLEQVTKHHKAADLALAEAVAAKRALEFNADDERKKLRRDLELSKKECSELAREAARIRLDAEVARTREMDRLQSSLKTESKFADQSSPIGRRDDRTVTETPRAATADT